MSQESSVQGEASVDRVPLLDVTRGNAPLLPAIRTAIEEICESGGFIGGPNCQALEESLAETVGTRHAIGCASGSDALLLALMALEIQPGDEVLVPSFTFFATASCVWRLGARPVWVDIQPDSFNLDPNDLEAKITPRTKAIIPVHLFGQCAEMAAIQRIADAHGLRVIEDAAQAIGATYRNRPAGSMSDIGCFSFYPTKNLGGFGDGGALTTDDPDLADRLRLLANHGMRPRYYHNEVGINSRLDAIQAAILAIKLQHLNLWTAGRTQNAKRYDELMTAAGLTGWLALPKNGVDGIHVWNQYTVRIPGGYRDQVRDALRERGVGSEVYYPVPLHRQRCFAMTSNGVSLPETDRAAEEVLSLPIFPELTETEQRFVVDQLAAVVHPLGAVQRAAS